MSISSRSKIGHLDVMPNDTTPRTTALIALMAWAMIGGLTLVWNPEGTLPSLALSLLRLAALVQGLRAIFIAAGLVPPSQAKE
jgi:hypothetical protein